MTLEGLSKGDTAWILASTALVLLMTPGLAFFYGGLVKGSNVLNTMMMCIISMGICSMTWMVIGFSLAFGGGDESYVIGSFRYAGLRNMEGQLWPGTQIPALLFMVFQMTFAVISAAIICGSVVERMRFSAFAFFSMFWSVLVYAPVCHWVWGPGGWIHRIGAQDFAGGMVVHECTAISALVLALCVGRRHSATGEEAGVDKHNVPFVVLGAALLWFGWSGFNGGSALAADELAVLSLVNTYMSAGASLVTWALLERLFAKRYSATGSVTGAVVGLVVITPAAGYVQPLSAAIMGALGCLIVYPSFDSRCAWARWVDDSLDAFPCHGVGGFVGTLLTGFFSTDGGLFYGGGVKLIGAQLLSAVVTAIYTTIMTALIYFFLRAFMKMRIDKEDELQGLDNMVHGECAYEHSPQKPYEHSSRKATPTKAFASSSSGGGEEPSTQEPSSDMTV